MVSVKFYWRLRIEGPCDLIIYNIYIVWEIMLAALVTGFNFYNFNQFNPKLKLIKFNKNNYFNDVIWYYLVKFEKWYIGAQFQ